jgi:murein tripeptide amidase MpaA
VAWLQWFVEGLLRRLLDQADPLCRALRRQATFHVVPNMNPDGSRRGYLVRTRPV